MAADSRTTIPVRSGETGKTIVLTTFGDERRDFGIPDLAFCVETKTDLMFENIFKFL